MLIINAKQFNEHEHLGMLLALRIPLFAVVTKIDMFGEDTVKSTLQALISVLNGPGRRLMPYIIKNEDDLLAVLPHFSFGRVIPIFLVSSVTGENIPLLINFLNLLPQAHHPDVAEMLQQDLEFQIHDVYQVPNVNTVVGGHVLAGHLQLRRPHQYYVGPFDDHRFYPLSITSIHRFCRPIQFVKVHQSATLAVSCERGPLRRGMVILTTPSSHVVWEFDVKLHLLYHASSLTVTQTTLIFCGSIRQAAKVVWIERALKSGEQCRVRFRFLNHPEWLKPGMSMLARDGSAGRMKCVGTILDIDISENAMMSL
ncbi:Short integuments 2, mitochondrial [Coelomomyces lativittatus]|nr:Short integuments 2, mitochondrial [Coelomomyces lativittatus]